MSNAAFILAIALVIALMVAVPHLPTHPCQYWDHASQTMKTTACIGR